MKTVKILVVEDESLVALSIISQLNELGYQVVGDAGDGAEALELCESLKPDLVLMDINLPRLNGIEASKLIKERFRIPVVIISGYSDEQLVRDASEAGVFNYLVKPVTKQNLGPAIEVAVRNHQDFLKAYQETEKLRHDLEERKLVERAKGILMEQRGLTEREAMKKLQKLSNDKNEKMAKIAKDVIAAGELLFKK